MEERRRSKRTEMSSTLMVKRLDQGDMQEVSIDIVDVSPNGVGFLCKEVLSIGAVYESKLRSGRRKCCMRSYRSSGSK